jgi:translation initiation factor 1
VAKVRFKLEGLSGESGWSVDEVCDKCGQNKSECLCGKHEEVLPPDKHKLVFRLEKRNGKPVTIVYQFCLSENDKKELLSYLKKSLGAGGSVKDGEIEIQGDIKEKLRGMLVTKGYGFKK